MATSGDFSKTIQGGGIYMATEPLPCKDLNSVEELKWPHNPCLIKGLKVGRDQIIYITLASW